MRALFRWRKDRFVTVRAPEVGYALAHTVEVPFWVRRGLQVLGILALIVGVFLFLPWTQNIAATGRVTALSPAVRPQTLHAFIPGRIQRWLVQEGQAVRQGDTLLLLGEIKDYYLDPQILQRMRQQLAAKEEAAQAQRRKIQALILQLQALRTAREVALARAQNALLQAQLRFEADSAAWLAAEVEYQLAQNQYVRQESLFVQGLRSLTELQNRQMKLQEAQAKLVAQRNRYEAARAEVANARLQLTALEADYAEKIAKAESDLRSTEAYLYDLEAAIAKLRNELANVQVRQSFYAVVAPQDGYLVRALKTGIGEVIKEGEPLAVFMPKNYRLAAEVYVRPLDVALLRPGAPVRLQFDGWPAFIFSGWPRVSFGTFGGRVYAIDYVEAGTGYFRVLIEPDPAAEPWPALLRLGGSVRAWFLLNDVPVWYEIWRQLNGFPPDLIPQFYQSDPGKPKGV